MGSVSLKIALGIALLVIFSFWGSQGARTALQISLVVIFTLALFISVIIDLGRLYRGKTGEEELEDSQKEELTGEVVEPEEADTIVVEAESDRDAKKGS